MAQVAIAWVAAQGSDIVPLIGARRRDRLAEALGALDVKLSADDLARLAEALPPDAVLKRALSRGSACRYGKLKEKAVQGQLGPAAVHP